MRSTYLSFQPFYSNERTEVKRETYNKSIALYIHIPFCEKKCYYCSIVTKQNTSEMLLDEYLSALEKEMISKKIKSTYMIKCVHIGGGTPSILNIKQLQKLMAILSENIYNFNAIEKVIEANTHSMTLDKIDFLSSQKNVTINYGIQTFDNSILKLINRDSNREKIMEILQYTSEKNFKSIGIDLMLGLPTSNLNTCLLDIEIAKSLNVDHIALYPLRIEPKTVFFLKMNEYENRIPNDENLCQIIAQCETKMKKLGYKQYSIFHYTAKNEMTHQYGREQLSGLEWIGIGAGAYSYINGYSFKNIENSNKYIQTINDCKPIGICINKMNLVQQIIHELLYKIRIGLIYKQEIIDSYGIYGVYFMDCLRLLIEKKYIVELKNTFVFTKLGILYVGDIENYIREYFDNIHKNIIKKNCNISNM